VLSRRDVLAHVVERAHLRVTDRKTRATCSSRITD
jgi:hypothetical protein